MKGNIISLDQNDLIESLYLGAEDSVSNNNVISLNFPSIERVQCLLDDLEAILSEPTNLDVVEPILREALQHIASELIRRS